MATAKLSAKEAAIEIGTDPRSLRKFIRSGNAGIDACGQGNRYEFTKAEVKALKKNFLAWSAGTKTKKDPIDKGVQEQDEIDRTTEEVDLDDAGDPIEDELLEEEDGLEDLEPTDEQIKQALLLDIEIEDLNLDEDLGG